MTALCIAVGIAALIAVAAVGWACRRTRPESRIDREVRAALSGQYAPARGDRDLLLTARSRPRGAGVDADDHVLALLGPTRRVIDHEDGLARLLTAMATASARGSGRSWVLEQALAAVPDSTRTELVTDLIETGDAHNAEWSSATADALEAAARAAVVAQVAQLRRAFMRGVR